MAAPTYTPYDGSSRPFTIGLSGLDPDRWIEPDGDLASQLAEKRRLAAERLDDILRSSTESLPAQRECLDMLGAYLARWHPNIYRRSADLMTIADSDAVDLADEAHPPIFTAGSLVQDDLVILERKTGGWTITAAHLAFPSSWSLAEKFLQPMDAVHAHVPGFSGGTRNATLVNRIFDNLQPDLPVERFNWSINRAYALYHPPGLKWTREQGEPEHAFIRVERQTLRRLPVTGAIVFTIRIYLDPLAAFKKSPDGKRLARLLSDQLAALAPEQIAYKGLSAWVDALCAYLQE
ncbi:heme-dependent oxidative N-demethylase family protein [Rhizobium halophytocola]|uniref:DUF3445 domain-containing protein n=1 Tax=Rhizobium halophytocola TaxID=735519 RepID=A0ABS4DTA5_9HYPH|nr:DUF3445 domain-containing protein [Rhizobium halophytocola]MBP1848916.1 hypothetical protein [Rhizobium halophytocola]